MPDVLEHNQCVYFWLPAAVESVSALEIGNLAFYSLFSAAYDRQRAGLPKPGARVYIDEFQIFASRSFEKILEQARSSGLNFILSNQNTQALKTPDVDLQPVVETNCSVTLSVGIDNLHDMKELSERSGQELSIFRGPGSENQSYIDGERRGPGGPSPIWKTRKVKEEDVHETPLLKNRLTIEDIAAASDHPLESILLINGGGGYSQFAGLPIRMRSVYPLHYETYQRYAHEPWPEGPLVDDKSLPDHDEDITDAGVRIDAVIKNFADEVLGSHGES